VKQLISKLFQITSFISVNVSIIQFYINFEYFVQDSASDTGPKRKKARIVEESDEEEEEEAMDESGEKADDGEGGGSGGEEEARKSESEMSE